MDVRLVFQPNNVNKQNVKILFRNLYLFVLELEILNILNVLRSCLGRTRAQVHLLIYSISTESLLARSADVFLEPR